MQIHLLSRAWASSLWLAGIVAVPALAAGAVTFNKDVLPILQKNCQSCHRAGEIAPMSFLTYGETRPWAKAIKLAVVSKKMPPWFADAQFAGHFRNERSLASSDVDTITAWVNSGALEGEAKDKPAPVHFAEGWSIGKPDMIVEYPHEISIPASGLVDQSNMLVKVNFPHDLWVTAAEVRPGNLKVVHHMKAWIRPPGSAWMQDAPEGELYKPTRSQFAPQPVAADSDRPRPVQDILAKYTPGVAGQEFGATGAAKFIAAGSDIVFEIHYTTTGKPEMDRSRVGIVFATETPKQRFVTLTGVNNTGFLIPAGATNHEVKGESTILAEALLAWVQPHMHLRAKDYELRAYYPSGESQLLLKGKFDFNWQVGYEFTKPVLLPKGTRLESIAHFDNSQNNPWNPNPNIDVEYGPQTTDEMAVSFMGFIVDVKADPSTLFSRGRRVQQVVE